MKRIILILALLSLGVSKAQVVGGYLPLNSTKSATMGGLKVSGNETVTGTFSVGSAATITGALNVGSNTLTSSTATLGPTKFNGAIVSDGSGISAGSGQITNVTNLLASGQGSFNSSVKVGSTTIIGGASNATLTGGNTGTVAVLSDALFQITFNSPSTNPADGVTYYFSNLNFPAQQTSTGGTVTIPYNCTLVGWDFNMSITGTIGSGETATLVAMANNATISVLSTAITFSNATGYNGFNATGLSVNFTAGDRLNIRMVSPTWATNPTQVYTGITLWFVRRS